MTFGSGRHRLAASLLGSVRGTVRRIAFVRAPLPLRAGASQRVAFGGALPPGEALYVDRARPMVIRTCGSMSTSTRLLLKKVGHTRAQHGSPLARAAPATLSARRATHSARASRVPRRVATASIRDQAACSSERGVDGRLGSWFLRISATEMRQGGLPRRTSREGSAATPLDHCQRQLDNGC